MIYLLESNNNTVLGNTANINYKGIVLWNSDYNIVLRNTLLENVVCVLEVISEGNLFEKKDCRIGTVPRYNVFFLLGILSVLVILIS